MANRYYALLSALLAGSLAGCAGILPGGGLAAGGATYRYIRTAAGDVTVEIVSTRDLDGGVLKIAPDGTMESSLSGASSRADVYLGLIDRALTKIPTGAR